MLHPMLYANVRLFMVLLAFFLTFANAILEQSAISISEIGT